ncbi:MAG: outer membrane beta-barrel protein [Lentimicrobiaceae bacterium]|jgi:hypothetical protein|nr:outer membrane beta-barrel protein [Lentimicrobiaceae bacterium]MCP4910565.1 outer membrane beta-barrel protein [Bacteroidota bacterium]MBT3455126.1 outer membrane beta-barrel protein [Lentimicrobiaceae bacterium]MBT3818695.1 outer membrane beta-barrel protein [Lentimicrobiaceae bacterium]MBT4062277.1 outer membrane beta-barrel protein [Lentimicrobiaceae bacterium]
MNNFRAILITLILLPLMGISQVEIAPSAGFMFGGRINYYQGELKINDNLNYGVSIIVPEIKWGTALELNYTRMDSEAKFRANPGYPDYQDTDFDISVNYIQIGVMKTLVEDDKLTPYGSFSLGTTIFSPKNDISDVWRFSITLGLGVKYMISDRIGVMARGRLMLPMIFGGIGGYVGIGTGGTSGGLSLNSYATIVEGDFNGGLIFKLGD